MKKALLILGIVLVTSLSVCSQNLTLSKGTTNYSNGDTVTVASSVTGTLACLIDVKNNSANTLSVKCLRTNINVVSGSTNSFCWFTCWAESVTLSPKAVDIPSDSTATEFSGDYFANGNSGVSIIRYRFFDMNNVADSVCFFSKFDVTVGINEAEPVTVSNLFPNPADNEAFLNYSISYDYSNAELRVIDILGNKVQIVPVYEKEGKIRINTENLNSGIYFYSMTLDGKPMFTKKLIVRHK